MKLPAQLQTRLTALGLTPDLVPEDAAAWTALLEQVNADYIQHIRERYLLNRLMGWLPEARQEAISQQADIPLPIRQLLQRKWELNDTRILVQSAETMRKGLQFIIAETSAILEDRQSPQPQITAEQFIQRMKQIQPYPDSFYETLNNMFQIMRMVNFPIEKSSSPSNFDDDCRKHVEWRSQNARYPARVHYQGTDAPCMFSGERNLSRNLLDCLVTNAVRFSPEDSAVHIRLQSVEDDLLLTVQDEGIGIPEADLPHVLEPFYRASNVQHIPGTGLGLTIVKLLADLYGGTVDIQSRVNAGTTVSVRLPRSEGSQAS